MKMVGVLALQGDFAAHEAALVRAGANTRLVRNADELGDVGGLVIPGGESTTMLKLLHYGGMMDALRRFSETKPIFGTCAGAILLAEKVCNPSQESLGAMAISVERNAYGRQNESRICSLVPEEEFIRRTGAEKVEAVFIRAPVIRKVGQGGRVLVAYNGDPVLVEQGMHLAATFHPELTDDVSVQRLFLGKL
ncbi:MAG: pyridoxal 5'-phosphate synthase glutaminase subunit PdxT [Alphaproteobacteria bacterium]|nr:pyridoxal 5'-phosphate synthase glutaminase subunit PdxT [Alphaproteobacteria bacterium]